jgi:hypothetical protein
MFTKMTWLTGTEIPSTTITATPKPIDVFTFFDTAKKVHIPKNNDKAMFSTNTALINNAA